jgi:putative transposase
MAHTFTNLLLHLIFSTKNREPVLDPEVKPRLFPYLGGIIQELGGRPVLINGLADHVHILAILPATASISDVLRTLKANSSRWIHETFPALSGFAWQTGYGAFSVSESNREAVRRYIEDQDAHHQKMTFLEELVIFLKKHNIVYDERYIGE